MADVYWVTIFYYFGARSKMTEMKKEKRKKKNGNQMMGPLNFTFTVIIRVIFV